MKGLNVANKFNIPRISVQNNNFIHIQQFILGPVSDWDVVTGGYVEVSLSSCHFLFKAVQACNAEHKVRAMGHHLQSKIKKMADLQIRRKNMCSSSRLSGNFHYPEF